MINLSSFQHKPFRVFFTGQVISFIGNWLQTTAAMVLVYNVTHSPSWLNLLKVFMQIPILLVTPFGGVAADHFSKKTLMIITNSCMFFCACILGTLALLGKPTPWEICLLIGSIGILNAYDLPLRLSFVSNCVPKEHITNAVTLMSAFYNAGKVIGPIIYNIFHTFFTTINEGWYFIFNGFTFLAVIISMFFIKKIGPEEKEQKKIIPPSQSQKTLFLDGWRYVRYHPDFRFYLILMGLISILGNPYAAFLPIFSEEILKVGKESTATFLMVSGTGSLTATLVLLDRRLHNHLEKLIFLSCFGLGVSLFLFASSTYFLLSLFLVFCVGFFLLFQSSCTSIYIQSTVEERFRGRVFSFYSIMTIGMSPIGNLCAAGIVKFISAAHTIQMAGVFCILIGVFFMCIRLFQRSSFFPTHRKKTTS